jgi:hypothetical protein
MAALEQLSSYWPFSPRMQHINNVCAEYEVALGAIAAYTSTADSPRSNILPP